MIDPSEGLSVLLSGEFFSPDERAALSEEMRRGPKDPSRVGEQGEYVLRLGTRNSNHVSVGRQWKELVRRRLDDLRPRFEARFGRRFGDCQKPRFLSYAEGQFFGPHRDRNLGPLEPPIVTSRSLSVVVFLNPGEYEGGTLILHEMGVHGSKMEIKGRPGGFVAFNPLVLHEVTPVTKGERFSIACWLERAKVQRTKSRYCGPTAVGATPARMP